MPRKGDGLSLSSRLVGSLGLKDRVDYNFIEIAMNESSVATSFGLTDPSGLQRFYE